MDLGVLHRVGGLGSGIGGDQVLRCGKLTRLQGQKLIARLDRLQARQLSATQDLIAADARAQAANAMQNAEARSAAEADWKRFYGNGVSYTPTPVNVFGGPAP